MSFPVEAVDEEAIEAVRARIKSFPEELKHHIVDGWPENVPGLKAGNPRYAEIQPAHLNTLWSMLDRIQQQNGPKADPIDASALVERLKALPPDLLDRVKANVVAKGHTLVNLEGPTAGPELLVAVQDEVRACSDEQRERQSRIHGLCKSIGLEELDRHALITQATGGRVQSSKSLTPEEIAACEQIVKGIELGQLNPVFASDGKITFEPAPPGSEPAPADEPGLKPAPAPGPETITVSNVDTVNFAELGARMRVSQRTMLARAKALAVEAGETEPKSLNKLNTAARKRLLEALGVALISAVFPGTTDVTPGAEGPSDVATGAGTGEGVKAPPESAGAVTPPAAAPAPVEEVAAPPSGPSSTGSNEHVGSTHGYERLTFESAMELAGHYIEAGSFANDVDNVPHNTANLYHRHAELLLAASGRR